MSTAACVESCSPEHLCACCHLEHIPLAVAAARPNLPCCRLASSAASVTAWYSTAAPLRSCCFRLYAPSRCSSARPAMLFSSWGRYTTSPVACACGGRVVCGVRLCGCVRCEGQGHYRQPPKLQQHQPSTRASCVSQPHTHTEACMRAHTQLHVAAPRAKLRGCTGDLKLPRNSCGLSCCCCGCCWGEPCIRRRSNKTSRIFDRGGDRLATTFNRGKGTASWSRLAFTGGGSIVYVTGRCCTPHHHHIPQERSTHTCTQLQLAHRVCAAPRRWRCCAAWPAWCGGCF